MRSQDRKRFDDLIYQIYQSSLTPAHIDSIINTLTKISCAQSCVILEYDRVTKLSHTKACYGMDDSAVQAYNREYNRIDPTHQLLSNTKITVIADEFGTRKIPKGCELLRTFVYDFVQAKANAYYKLSVNITPDHYGDTELYLMLIRDKSAAPFDQETAVYVESCANHLSRWLFQNTAANRQRSTQLTEYDLQTLFSLQPKYVRVAYALATHPGGHEDIAKALGLSASTVKTYASHIYEMIGSSGKDHRSYLSALVNGHTPIPIKETSRAIESA